jgi:hypothetical protein
LSPGNDDATRYLCAASYLDPAYNTRVLKEFLVEPTRPIPPSPGVDAARVLTEAVRARARRKNYDGILVLLGLLIIGIAWDQPVLYAWFVLALLLSVTNISAAGTPALLQPVTFRAVVGILVVIGFAVIAGFLISEAINSSSSSRYYYDYDGSLSSSSSGDSSTGRLVVAIVLAFVALVVCMGERWTLWQLLTTRFRRGAPAAPGGGSLTGFLTENFQPELARYQKASAPVDGAPLIVYRGYYPFVGSGGKRNAWSIAIPLEKLPEEELDELEEGEERPELTTDRLYTHIRSVLERLQQSGGLSPDLRLRDLTVTEEVFTPAPELVDHLADDDAVSYLPNLYAPPNTSLSREEVDRIRLTPREWSRYYLCTRVETWDRDLVLSAYVHVAVDETTLYLEWTPFVLTPIRAEYRAVDRMRTDSYRPFWLGFMMWLRLPFAALLRIGNLASWIRTPKRENGVIDPDRYGVQSSLRELAAGGYTDYFQQVDIERYEKIIDAQLLPSIGALIEAAGYSTAKFEEQTATVINNEISIGGDNSGAITQVGQKRGLRRLRATVGGSKGKS